MLKTTRGKILALLFVAAVAGGGFYAWQAGWLSMLQPKPKDKEKDNGKELPKLAPSAVLDLWKTLEVSDDAQKATASKELKAAYKDGFEAKVATLVAEAKKKDIDPYFVLEAKNAGTLTDLVPKDRRLSVAEARELRAYLHAWRVQLIELRKAARTAALQDIDAAKFGTALPTLGLLSELGTGIPVFKSLEAPLDPDPGAKPALPWFGPADCETAEALHALFVKSPAAGDFAAERLGIKERPTLAVVLVALGDKQKLMEFNKAFAGELRKASATDGPVKDRATLEPVDTAVSKFVLAAEQNLQIPKVLKQK